MNTDSGSEDLAINNEQSLQRLARAIVMSQGEFSLILVCCNYPSLGSEVANHLQEISSYKIQQLVVKPSIQTLLTSIIEEVEDPLPSALIVFGLESVEAIDKVLSATNLVRDEFRKCFPFPLILWINEPILHKMIRLAPDFKGWDLNPVRLNFPDHHLLKELVPSLSAITI